MSKERWVAIEDTTNLIDDHIEIRNCSAEYVCNQLNKKEKRIAELEEQLANSIRPKFKVGQKIYYIGFYMIGEDIIKGFEYNSYDNEFIYRFKNEISEHSESSIFTTLDEAESKLKELKGE